MGLEKQTAIRIAGLSVLVILIGSGDPRRMKRIMRARLQVVDLAYLIMSSKLENGPT